MRPPQGVAHKPIPTAFYSDYVKRVSCAAPRCIRNQHLLCSSRSQPRYFEPNLQALASCGGRVTCCNPMILACTGCRG